MNILLPLYRCLFLLAASTTFSTYASEAATEVPVYLLGVGEQLRWHCHDGETLIERRTPLNGEQPSELIHKDCFLPLVMLHNHSNALLGAPEMGRWLAKKECHHFDTPVKNPLHLMTCSSQEEILGSITLVCKAASSDATNWPPNELSLFFSSLESQLFLCATFEVDIPNKSARLLKVSCHNSIGEQKKPLTLHRKWLPESFCSGKEVLVVLNESKTPSYLQLHCLNKEIIGDTICHWKGNKELSLFWQLQQPKSTANTNDNDSEKIGKKKAVKQKRRSYSHALITRSTTANSVDLLRHFASEFADEQKFYESSNSAGRYQRLWENLSAITNYKVLETKPYVRGKSVPVQVWQEVSPYFLPENHPLRSKLDQLFKTRITLNHHTLKEAGFLTPRPRQFSHSIVSKNKKIKGFVFKFFSDDQPKIDDAKQLLKRILGAKAINQSLKRLGWDKHFIVPKKWIYPLPENPAPPEGSFRKNFILIAEEINVYHNEANRVQWRTKITPLLLRGVYSIVTDVGLYDSLIPSNIPFAKPQRGKMVFLDTEHFGSSPIPYKRITPYLSPEMEQVWNALVSKKKVTAFHEQN